MSQLVVHIVPQLPPQVSGVGDYATLVGKRMEELGGVTCCYVAIGHQAVVQPADGANVRNVTGNCDAGPLWAAVESLADERRPTSTAVVLHYSGYGYEPNGSPGWLANALRSRPANLHLGTYFHELYATSWPWRRAFWSSSRQQWTTAEVARHSDAIATNRELSARWLEQRLGQRAGTVKSLPISSNIGEAARLVPFSEREPIAVFFGASEFKRDFLERHAAATAAICESQGIREAYSIGERVAPQFQQFAERGIQLEEIGLLPAEEVAAWLQRGRIAFVTYYPKYLAKSGSLAALAAHGIPTVMGDECVRESDGLIPGHHYLRLSDAREMTADPKVLAGRLSDVGTQLFDWYQSHTAAMHARELLSLTAAGSMPRKGAAVTC